MSSFRSLKAGDRYVISGILRYGPKARIWELEVSRTCSLERVALLPLVRINANVVERAANVQSGHCVYGWIREAIWFNLKSNHMSNQYMKACM